MKKRVRTARRPDPWNPADLSVGSSQLALAWVRRLDELGKTGDYDGGNAHSVKIGAALCRTGCLETAEETAPLWPAASTATQVFVDAMSRKRTDIQQDFSAIVFRFLSDALPFRSLAMLDAAMEREGCPQWAQGFC